MSKASPDSHPRAPSHHRALALAVTALVAIGLARLPGLHARPVSAPQDSDVASVDASIDGATARRGPRSLDPNTATRVELETLPGVGPAIAARIVAARPFRHVDDLLRVRGIGPRTIERIRPWIAIQTTDDAGDVTDRRSTAPR